MEVRTVRIGPMGVGLVGLHHLLTHSVNDEVAARLGANLVEMQIGEEAGQICDSKSEVVVMLMLEKRGVVRTVLARATVDMASAAPENSEAPYHLHAVARDLYEQLLQAWERGEVRNQPSLMVEAGLLPGE